MIKDRNHEAGFSLTTERPPDGLTDEAIVELCRLAWENVQSRVTNGPVRLEDPAKGLCPDARIVRSTTRGDRVVAAGCLAVLVLLVLAVIASFVLPLAMGHDDNWARNRDYCWDFAQANPDQYGDWATGYENCMRSAGLDP